MPAASSKKSASKLADALAPVHVVVFFTKTTTWQTRILHDLDKFDCQIYIPDVDKLVMNGNNIMVPDHIMKTLDDQLKMKQDDEQLKMKHRFKKRKMMQIASMEEPNKDQ